MRYRQSTSPGRRPGVNVHHLQQPYSQSHSVSLSESQSNSWLSHGHGSSSIFMLTFDLEDIFLHLTFFFFFKTLLQVRVLIN